MAETNGGGPTNSFLAMVLEEDAGAVRLQIKSLPSSALPENGVTVRVEYSSLNYKDALVMTGQGNLVRSYPHIPGIDLAGKVVDTGSSSLEVGEDVILTGWRVGELHWGGYSQLANVNDDWLVRRPSGLSLRNCMTIGTAGFTAMLCVMALEDRGLKAGDGAVLVTGASGGVGSVAVAILASLGHDVVAVTGRPELSDYLRRLGAKEVVKREDFSGAAKPLEKEMWAGCVDSVGGLMLANILPKMRYGSAVAACGLAGGRNLATTVIPFIIRGVSLIGVDSVLCPQPHREAAWKRLASDLTPKLLEDMTTVVPLRQAPELSKKILNGSVRGRVVVDVNG